MCLLLEDELNPLKLQESSLFFGLSHIVAVVAEFDEYSNDFLYLNEGSCLPRYQSPLQF
jgi:hypothetical protein